MAASQDYTRMMQEMMASVPMDMSSFQNSLRSCASFGEKISKVALEAADKSTDISARWTKQTIAGMNDAAALRDEPSEYGRAMTDFASAQAEMGAETMAAFAEVAKKVQMETVELMLAAGKDMSENMTAAAKTASGETGRKATATAK